MTRNQKAVQLFVSCNIKTCNAKKLAEKHGVDRRDLSYLNAISSLVSSDCFKFICDAVMRCEYIFYRYRRTYTVFRDVSTNTKKWK